MPKKPNRSPQQFKVGDPIRVSMHGGTIVEAVIKAIIEDIEALQKLR